MYTKDSNFKGKAARRESIRVQTDEKEINIPVVKNYFSVYLLKKKSYINFSWTYNYKFLFLENGKKRWEIWSVEREVSPIWGELRKEKLKQLKSSRDFRRSN